MTTGFSIKAVAFSALLMISAAPALAAPCGTGTFEAWLEDFKKEAASKGISPSAVATGLAGVTLDKAVITRDHSLSAQWEHTILVTEDGYEVLTLGAHEQPPA